ncbi:hypothetical protein PPL_09575 [Heterostelium album PN500]|uniref:Fe2OG dioxygenase domain-containing protein n=1 Tax=Heterostelium pallidum (strain ATCC 26659 / Pp 5 / PN500) TaxID=670386 RepID=D3BNQ4_HETP5|nr:hypothetical protein PPL_09575 [Heterostelium album PN500]EFA76823.1 hypothetical protein PPL_09575 [Heterostelium album PN500]|eukprot:XP_020428955.1 hypothetical protein PPL_09575 [Heterostelium album PN500]
MDSIEEIHNNTKIPIIDIGGLSDENNIEEWKRISNQIDAASIEYGFFYVKNHGIPMERLDQITGGCKDLFNMPLEEKMKIDISKSINHRGYGCVYSEQLDPDMKPDLKETFSMGINMTEDDPLYYDGLNGPNQYPEYLGAKWSGMMESYFYEIMDVSLRILRAISFKLGAPLDYFDTKYDKTVSSLRLIHYPPVLKRQANIYDKDVSPGCGSHTDYGCISLLYQDIAGLQIESKSKWIDAPPIPGTFVVNIGDMLERWSNNRYKSTLHRVLSPINQDRYVFALFSEPASDVMIGCLPGCTSPSNPWKYSEITTGDYLHSRFNDTYAYRRNEEDPKN